MSILEEKVLTLVAYKKLSVMQCPFTTQMRHLTRNVKKQSSAGVLSRSCPESFTCSRFYKAYRTLSWITTEKDSAIDIFPVHFS